MTLAAAITMVLNRVNLSTSNTAYRDRARDYLSFVLGEVTPSVPWWWLDRITTFNTVASTRTYKPISGNVGAWYSFVDDTNGRLLSIIGSDEVDALDPEQDDTGTVEAVCLEGLDATTGYPVIALYRIPNAVISVRVRYRIDLGAFASTQDGSELLTLGVPRVIENVLIHGATGLYLEDEGDETLSVREFDRQQRCLDVARRQQSQVQGNRRYIPRRSYGEAIILRFGTDTVTAP
uniref:Uncharacterized protein n=1 Tax=viral metagenome TaxID=1070528 RepID=A0A6M3IF95_9ZZZZ